MRKVLLLSLLILVGFAWNSGCRKDKGDPPVLPPAESMIINFSDFASGKKSSPDPGGIKGVENSSWEFAALVAGYWNTIIKTTLTVPFAAYTKATQTNASYVSENLWQWSFNLSITTNQTTSTYKCRLTGEIRVTDVQWKMYVSGEGTNTFPEFVWLEGTSQKDASSGNWIIYHSQQFPEEVLHIDWTKSGNEISSVIYNYVRNLNNSRQSDPFKGSYITYGTTSNALDRFYDIHYFNGISFSDVRIEWNSASKEGRIRSLAYFGNNNWYCWNSNQINVVCP
jgi:hypothetical protein